LTCFDLPLSDGLSRAAWESVGVALTAEWFGADEVSLSAAFAARLMFDGLGGAAAFFSLPSLNTRTATLMLGGLAAAGGTALLIAMCFEATKRADERRHVVAPDMRRSSAGFVRCTASARASSADPWPASDPSAPVLEGGRESPTSAMADASLPLPRSSTSQADAAASGADGPSLLHRGSSAATLLLMEATSVAWDQGSLIAAGAGREPPVTLPSPLSRQLSMSGDPSQYYER
jgi:hypothetical protein